MFAPINPTGVDAVEHSRFAGINPTGVDAVEHSRFAGINPTWVDGRGLQTIGLSWLIGGKMRVLFSLNFLKFKYIVENKKLWGDMFLTSAPDAYFRRYRTLKIKKNVKNGILNLKKKGLGVESNNMTNIFVICVKKYARDFWTD